jgi:hypothetical protein
MRAYERVSALLLGILCTAGIAMGATTGHIEDSAKKTTLTVTALTQLPGTTLAAGSYVFRQSGEQSGWDIVQVYNSDQSSLVTTMLAYPNPNLVSNGQAFLVYPQSTDNQTQIMEAFFFDGDAVAQQLAYPKKTADAISAANHVRVPTTGTSDAYPSSLPLASASWSDPVNQREDASAAPQTQSSPDTAARTAQDPQAASDPQAAGGANAASSASAPSTSTARSEPLPQTSSPLPLIGLIGLLAVVGIVVLRRVGRAS